MTMFIGAGSGRLESALIRKVRIEFRLSLSQYHGRHEENSNTDQTANETRMAWNVNYVLSDEKVRVFCNSINWSKNENWPLPKC